MGSLLGHVVPGSMFLTWALWLFIGEVWHQRLLLRASPTQRRSSSISPAWYPCPCKRIAKFPFEPLWKVSMMVLGVLGELVLSKSSALYDENGEFIAAHIDNYAHSVMYCFFGFSGIVDLALHFHLLKPPPKFDYLIISVAFWIEGFLFYYHLHGRDELNVRLHTILYLVIFITAAVFLLDALSDQLSAYMGFLKSYLISLQGSWFYQIGFVLFGSQPWRNTPTNVEFLGIAFAFHVLFLLIVHFLVHAICCHFFARKRRRGGEIRSMENATPSEEMVLITRE